MGGAESRLVGLRHVGDRSHVQGPGAGPFGATRDGRRFLGERQACRELQQPDRLQQAGQPEPDLIRSLRGLAPMTGQS
jgi:hypothetical protein